MEWGWGPTPCTDNVRSFVNFFVVKASLNDAKSEFHKTWTELYMSYVNIKRTEINSFFCARGGVKKGDIKMSKSKYSSPLMGDFWCRSNQ